MNKVEYINWEEKAAIEQQKVRNKYFALGFTVDELDILHQAFSPIKIPKGLSKLQVRRKINYHLKHKGEIDYENNKNPYYNCNSLELRINGKLFIHANFGSKVPENNGQLKKLLKVLMS